MSERCEPPEEFRHLEWHWLRRGTFTAPALWCAGDWAMWGETEADMRFPAEAYGMGWRYLGPAILPETKP